MAGVYRGDFARNTFDPLDHVRRVLMQQGRVMLEADWNEQAAVLLHYLEALATDLIGRHGGPAENCGFAIGPTVPGDFRIGPGHYYVDGILCELEATPVRASVQKAKPREAVVSGLVIDGTELLKGQYVDLSQGTASLLTLIVDVVKKERRVVLNDDVSQFDGKPDTVLRRVTTYLTQPDLPEPEATVAAKTTYQVYLDVWERHVSHVEDPRIREVALGGPDTAARAKVVWQVKVLEWAGPKAATVEELQQRFQPDTRGLLKATTADGPPSDDPCILAPEARYRGEGNQLYRVEIHRPGPAWDGNDGTKAGAATFKWSRENGAVVFPVAKVGPGGSAQTVRVVLESLGQDHRLGLAEDDWVELQDDAAALGNHADGLLRVQAIDRTTPAVTLRGSLGGGGQAARKNPLLRRWDQFEGDPTEGGLQLSDGAALVREDVWLMLETGIQIQLDAPGAGEPANQYRTGDYWLIPARQATGGIEWPTIPDYDGEPMPLSVPPHGVEHHYAPIAIVKTNPDRSFGAGDVTSSRPQFTVPSRT